MTQIWENASGKKLYLTGGIGARPNGEAFGDNYELPNLTAYNETCAAVANVFWNERLFLLHGDAKYVDVLERTLYNGLLSGVSLDGTKFFYPNPLESDGSQQRSPWFGCACCPGNLTRFLPSVPGYFYAQSNWTIYVNLFAAGTADVKLPNGRIVNITQQTRYPWDGAVKMTVGLDWAKNVKLTLKIRVPGWARNEASAGRPLSIRRRGERTGDSPGQWPGGADPARSRLRDPDPPLGIRRRDRTRSAHAHAPRGGR